jgi:shikimate kinase
MTQPLFLIGPRGCGKTTVGMALADSLNRRFVDTDQWLQSQLNMTVAEIVEREEWAGFLHRYNADSQDRQRRTHCSSTLLLFRR